MKNFNEQLDKALNTWGAPKETLAEIVASYQNNELGSGGNVSTGDSTTSSGCDCADKVDVIQEQLNLLTESVNATSEKLNNLLNKIYDRNAIFDTDYDHIDPSVIFRTYDFFEREQDCMATYSFATLPIGLFCLNGQEATLKITMRLKSSIEDDAASFKLYLNGITYLTQSITNIPTEEKTYEFTYTLPLLDTGNTIELLFFASGANLTLTYYKYECYNCTNPTFIDHKRLFDVDYFNGNYYFTDCSGKTAKYAIAQADGFHSMDGLTWIDTGIEALCYRFMCSYTQSGSLYVTKQDLATMYLGKNNSLYVNDVYNNKNYTDTNISFANPASPRVNELHIHVSTPVSRKINSRYYIYRNAANRAYSNIETNSRFGVWFAPKVQLDEISMVLPSTFYIGHETTNNLIIKSKSTECSLGYGQFQSAYVTSFSPFTVEVFTKVRDYTVKHTASFNISSSSGSLTSYVSEVIGKNYDYYFKGVNNDYFIIQNGKWQYYSSELNEA